MLIFKVVWGHDFGIISLWPTPSFMMFVTFSVHIYSTKCF